MDVGTNKKAFQINLDLTKYGTFAEIGAGPGSGAPFFCGRRRGRDGGEDDVGL